MKILVVAATNAELAPLFAHFNLEDGDFVSTEKFDVIVTGVGMVATAFALGKFLANNSYNLIINLGIAGCFDTSAALGSVFKITKDSFADFGAEDNERFLSVEELGFGKQTFLSSINLMIDLPEATGITINTISGSVNSIENREKRWEADTESMEGAAVFYVAEKQKIAAIQVRSISNYITPRNKSTWNIGLAIENLNKWAIEFLENPTYF